MLDTDEEVVLNRAALDSFYKIGDERIAPDASAEQINAMARAQFQFGSLWQKVDRLNASRLPVLVRQEPIPGDGIRDLASKARKRHKQLMPIGREHDAPCLAGPETVCLLEKSGVFVEFMQRLAGGRVASLQLDDHRHAELIARQDVDEPLGPVEVRQTELLRDQC